MGEGNECEKVVARESVSTWFNQPRRERMPTANALLLRRIAGAWGDPQFRRALPRLKQPRVDTSYVGLTQLAVASLSLYIQSVEEGAVPRTEYAAPIICLLALDLPSRSAPRQLATPGTLRQRIRKGERATCEIRTPRRRAHPHMRTPT